MNHHLCPIFKVLFHEMGWHWGGLTLGFSGYSVCPVCKHHIGTSEWWETSLAVLLVMVAS